MVVKKDKVLRRVIRVTEIGNPSVKPSVKRSGTKDVFFFFVIAFICAWTGFGAMWYYFLLHWNVFVSIFIGLLVSALTMAIFCASSIFKEREVRL